MSTYLAQAALAFPAIDPVLFQIGPIAIRWYSLAYIAGILLGWWYAKRIIANHRLWGGKPPFTTADLDDFLFWAVIGIIVGGRLGFVLFYDLPFYLANPVEIFSVWRGGMSFHGGFIGTTIAMVLYARARGIPVWRFLDVIAAVVPIGLFFGRLANFINAELWGRTTDVPWGVIFPNAGDLPRHPSQLYEAILEGFLLFLVIRWMTHRKAALQKPRLTTGIFVAGYGLGRTIVEFFREPDAQLGYLFGGWLTMGMVLSIPMIIIGIGLIATARPAPKTQVDQQQT